MSRSDYEVVIGLEVHAELSTKTKIFCSCPTEFGAAPNTHVCPICMAMPGTLPVLNEKVVEYICPSEYGQGSGRCGGLPVAGNEERGPFAYRGQAKSRRGPGSDC